MGQSTEELSSEIAQTRQRLTADVDALEDKVSPTRIVERRKQSARDRVGRVRDKVMGSAQSATSSVGDQASGIGDKAGETADQAKQVAQERFEGAPIAAGLIAFGAGVVLAGLLPATRAEARVGSTAVSTVKEKAQPLVEDAKQAASQVGEQVKESATEAAQDVKQSAPGVRGHRAGEGRSAAQDVRSDASPS